MLIENGAGIEEPAAKLGGSESASAWTFLTNHSHVLICLARDSTARLRDVAQEVGITERAVQRIVSDLEGEGVLAHVREGRRNRYAIHAERHLRHPVEAHTTVSALLAVVLMPGATAKSESGTNASL